MGGGVVGICVALCLQRSGRSVTVLERTLPGDGASGHNGGVLSIGDCAPIAMPGVLGSVPRMLRDPLSPFAISWPYLPRISPWLLRFIRAGRRAEVERIAAAIAALMDAALPSYRALITGTEAEPWFRPGGLLYGYATDESFAAAQYGIGLRERQGLSVKVLDDEAITTLDPLLAGRFRHGVYLPDAHHTPEPGEFTRALARVFLDGGGQLEIATVTGFETNGDVIEGVNTTSGRRLAGEVVLAAGAWSRDLARQLGARVPLDTERGYGVRVPGAGFGLRFPVISGDYHIALSPELRGIRIVGTVEFGGLTAPPKRERAQRLEAAARRIFPELSTKGAPWWMSYRPSMPDSLPVIGRAPRYSNAYLAFGHGHRGIAQAAITGRLISDLADGNESSFDLAPYRPERFSLRR
ncbi:NAD(P)/FAD-dependent oxidoreductase [Kribbella sp. NPDC049227]|uniref:NAD(P)/FAD-dependent oxidoreductase n=1 Tax=Kribbella sp. NPDC049227 TaxID=3364113 RepID=UPI0037154463